MKDTLMHSLRRLVLFCMFLLATQLAFCVALMGQPAKIAIVHLMYVDFRGKEIQGPGTIDLFQESTDGSKNLAHLFHNNVAADVPYGIYRLKTYMRGYYSANRNVLVFQSEIWVVLQLSVGVDDGPTRYILPGTVIGLNKTANLVWIRAQGLHSDVIADGKVEANGKFEIAGLPEGIYVLTIRQDNHVIDIRTVKLPSDEKADTVTPVDIKIKE